VITIEPLNVQGVAAMFARAPDMAMGMFSTLTQATVAHLEAEVKDRTPTAFGTLRASIFGEVRELPAGVEGVVGTGLSYAPHVEFGTRPHFPPVEPLQDWVRKKFAISDEAEVKSRAFLVARAIAQRGTLAVGMFHTALAANEAQIEHLYERGAVQLIDEMRAAGQLGGGGAA